MRLGLVSRSSFVGVVTVPFHPHTSEGTVFSLKNDV